MRVGIRQADITPMAGSGAGEHLPSRFVLE